MLATVLRIFMLVLYLGVVWPSHASSELSASTENVQVQQYNHMFFSSTLQTLPSHVTQHIAESSSFDVFFAKSHGNSLALETDNDHAPLWNIEQNSVSTGTPIEQPQRDQHSQESRSLDLALASSSRMASFYRHDPEEIDSLYELAIELPIEPALSFAKDYSVDFHSALDWTLKVASSSNRIAGWKDSNLIYTLYQHRLSLA